MHMQAFSSGACFHVAAESCKRFEAFGSRSLSFASACLLWQAADENEVQSSVPSCEHQTRSKASRMNELAKVFLSYQSPLGCYPVSSLLESGGELFS